jgi:putative ABC transport system permease protein
LSINRRRVRSVVVRPSALIYFYRKRLRVHAVQELLAGLGIAVGVALVFSVQVANSSITGSARQILHALAGDATLQLAARDADGLDQGTLARVQGLPGVADASALLDQRATISFGARQVQVDLAGVDANLPSLDGIATRHIGLGGLLIGNGLVLPVSISRALGLADNESVREGLPEVTVATRGRVRRTAVAAVLDRGTIGPLSEAFLGVVSLRFAQDLSGLHGRVTRILVAARPGEEALARRGLERVAGGRLTVASVDDELRSLQQATAPIAQSTSLFAAISAFVGLLFTFTAMLLTVPERRRFAADLRIMGYRRGSVAQILAFQAILLGIVASGAGLVAGWLLSQTGAHDPPGYLAFAYPLGTQRVIGWGAVLMAFFSGVVATCLAASRPLLDLRRRRAMNDVLVQAGEPGHAVGAPLRRALAACGLLLFAVAGLVLLLEPAATIGGIIATAVAMVLVVPVCFALVLNASDGPADRWRLNSLALAIRQLRATSLRSLGLVATGAVAVFGAVGLEGAHRNLLHGLYSDYRGYVGTADIWIAQPGDDLALQPFDGAGVRRRVQAVSGVRAVRAYRGGLLDLGHRRVWVIARPRGDRDIVPSGQLVDGNREGVERVRGGGWVTISQQIADDRGIAPGGRIELPTPTGTVAYRVAATTTNLGWGPGAIVMSDGDYRRAWSTSAMAALEVDVDAGANPGAVADRIRQSLGPARKALLVQTAEQRSTHANGIARAGLAQLGQIAKLLLLAAALALAAAMGAGVYQRRGALAQLRVMGWRSRKLWRALLWESALILGTSCLIGAAAGVYGHFLGDRWLRYSTGYPAPFAFAAEQTIALCLLVTVAAVVVAAIPGFFVAKTPPHVGLDPGT